MNTRPLLTVCIPAYNRAQLLAPLLNSIVQQDFQDFEILICEDGSPERDAIRQVTENFSARYPGRIRYRENANNLGYDGNIRELVECSRGQFCVFMGNDDLLCPGALSSIADIAQRIDDCGVIVRTYATFDTDPSIHKQVFRYYAEEHVFPAGQSAIAAGYRRSVVIPGMVIKRDAAAGFSTDRFDGTLLYQLYLVGMILAHHSVVFTPNIIALRRDGTPPDFGNSAAERGKFVPQNQTPASSLHFMHGMLDIARYIEIQTGMAVYNAIRADIGAYSYPILAIQAKQPLGVFLKYGVSLARLGFWRSPLFHAYFTGLLLVGPERLDRLIIWIKNKLGHTPRLGAARGKSS
ncbi:glycosyltransferase family 2 protein [Methylobacillus methanolivorans]